ncbi:hypothetical protein ONZ45_g18560 [Pleurotus djamor]|nr:hypothetical protein ONZ45_g18560 [Pleurotus djamor]
MTVKYRRFDNWQAALIKQYFKRAPDANPLGGEPQGRYSKSIEPTTVPSSPKIEESDGPEQPLPRGDDAPENNEPTTSNSSDEPSMAVPESVEEPEVLAKDWFKLSLLEKLDSMHLLTEWQFQNPTRLKQVMKSEDENASWRIEPIGFDSKKNAYWLIGEDRLWIQRNPPRPNLKRKRTAKPPAKPAPTKRSRVEASSRNKRSSIVIPAKDTPSGRGPGRAAKLQAKQKLDAQAKELAELNRQAALATPSKSTRRTRSNAPNTSPSPTKLPGRSASNARPLGTRLSLRLRGSLNDEWQSVPDEWLAEPKSEQSKPSLKTGLESDDETVSDLTELSEDVTPPKGNSEEPPAERSSPPQDEHPEPPAEKAQSEQPDQNGSEHPADFVEWETIAVTLEEWQSVAEPFAKATHYSEKALFKVLTAVAAIIEIDRKRRKEEAITHRKRSSRLALREIEKEEARLAAKKRADEEEKHSRARRAEARQQKEESERQRRENAREQRRMEREAKEAAQETQRAPLELAPAPKSMVPLVVLELQIQIGNLTAKFVFAMDSTL